MEEINEIYRIRNGVLKTDPTTPLNYNELINSNKSNNRMMWGPVEANHDYDDDKNSPKVLMVSALAVLSADFRLLVRTETVSS